MLLACSPAHAATITVNTTADELATDGNCSLREALQAANTDTAIDGCAKGSGADTVVVPAGSYDFSAALAGSEDNGLWDVPGYGGRFARSVPDGQLADR